MEEKREEGRKGEKPLYQREGPMPGIGEGPNVNGRKAPGNDRKENAEGSKKSGNRAEGLTDKKERK